MANFFSKIGKGLKKIWKKSEKIRKKIFKSKLFKVALAAAAIYFGGAALGWWGQGAPAAGSTVVNAATNVVPNVVPNASTGILGKVGGFIEANPMASAMLLQSAGSAASPDEIDIMNEQEKIRQKSWQNMQTPDSLNINQDTRNLTTPQGGNVYNSEGGLEQAEKSPEGQLSQYYQKYGLLGRKVV